MKALQRGLRGLSFLLLVGSLSCGGTSSEFSRAPEIPAAKAMLGSALVATDRQYQTLVRVGGTVIGWVHVESKEPSEMTDEAQRRGAQEGGTHVIYMDGDSSIDWTAPRGSPMFGNRDHTQTWVAVRVPAQSWSSLPDGLRPREGVDYVYAGR